jgi:exosome complex RNA-binding protein Csl4
MDFKVGDIVTATVARGQYVLARVAAVKHTQEQVLVEVCTEKGQMRRYWVPSKKVKLLLRAASDSPGSTDLFGGSENDTQLS